MKQVLLEQLSKYSILYAEDEKGIQEEIKDILELLFKEVYIADNGLEAKKLYKEYLPDLIITDIKMPRLSGLDFIKDLRKSDDKTFVAITTAFTDLEYILLATELNLLKYIVKPVTKPKLYEIFEKFLEKKNSNGIIQLSKDYTFHKNRALIYFENKEYKLTSKELIFLNHILDKKAIVTYEEIEYILETDNYYNQNAIRQFIKKLRKKLPPSYLLNIQNEGYTISSNFL